MHLKTKIGASFMKELAKKTYNSHSLEKEMLSC
jgi:hypothetical protein